MTCWRTRLRSAPSLMQHLGGDALALADQAEQDVLGADVVVAELQRLAQRELEDLLGARRERDVPAGGLLALADDLLDLCADGLERDAEALQGLGGDAVALVDQAEQDVLGADVVVESMRASSWASTTTRRARSVNRSNMGYSSKTLQGRHVRLARPVEPFAQPTCSGPRGTSLSANTPRVVPEHAGRTPVVSGARPGRHRLRGRPRSTGAGSVRTPRAGGPTRRGPGARPGAGAPSSAGRRPGPRCAR